VKSQKKFVENRGLQQIRPGGWLAGRLSRGDQLGRMIFCAGDDYQPPLDERLSVHRSLKFLQEPLQSQRIAEKKDHRLRVFVAGAQSVRLVIQHLRAGKAKVAYVQMIAPAEPVHGRVRIRFQNEIPDMIRAVPRTNALPKAQISLKFFPGGF